MSDLPPVSIVIPTFNRAHLIARAIQSAFGDLQPEDEIIVVDDGSTDNTSEVVSAFATVRYVPIAQGGAGKARNLGVQLAKNDLIAFLDSDDEWMPGGLNLRRAVMHARPQIVFCFTDFATKVPGAALQHGALVSWHKDLRPWSEILAPGVRLSELTSEVVPSASDVMVHLGSMAVNQLRAGYIATTTVMVRRSLGKDALRFAEDTPTYEDYECFGRLSLCGDAAYIDCETAIQHGHASPRLTDATYFVVTATRLKLMERVWGQDAAFLAQNGKTYAEAVDAQRNLYVRLLLAAGQCEIARNQLRQMKAAPFGYALLSALPGSVTKNLLSMRRRLLAKMRYCSFLLADGEGSGRNLR